jgi:hypothetical protein
MVTTLELVSSRYTDMRSGRIVCKKGDRKGEGKVNEGEILNVGVEHDTGLSPNAHFEEEISPLQYSGSERRRLKEIYTMLAESNMEKFFTDKGNVCSPTFACLQKVISCLEDQFPALSFKKVRGSDNACSDVIGNRSEIGIVSEDCILISLLSAAFHLSLKICNDEAAAYILSRILYLSSERSLSIVDLSSVLDSVVDSKKEGIKQRTNIMSYCCNNKCSLVLHLLLTVYTLEWSLVTDHHTVEEHATLLLKEIGARHDAPSAAVLVYHMKAEGISVATLEASEWVLSAVQYSQSISS